MQPGRLPISPSPQTEAQRDPRGDPGALLGIGLAFLLERLNRRLRDPEEVQEAYGLPMIAMVPESKEIDATNHGETAAELPFLENESLRMLRYFNADQEVQAVLVSSHAAASRSR